MIKRLLLFCTLSISQIVIGQSYNYTTYPDSIDGIPIYMFPVTDPEFPGGEEKLNLFISDNLEYDSTLPCYSGRVYIEFIIMPNGILRNIRVVRGVQESIDQYVIEMCEKMPNWKPATVDGEEVATKWVLPVKLLVRDE